MKTATFNVSGMHCSSCSMLISMNLGDLQGVESVECDHASGRTEVNFDEARITPEQIAHEITESGYDAVLVG